MVKSKILAPKSMPFNKWQDADFYDPDKAHHVYLYGDYSPKLIQEFRDDLQAAAQSKKKKPIVIHVHSPGGNSDLGITVGNMLKEIPIPLAVIVDGYACSAATPLLVSAPYRVANEAALILIHEGRIILEHTYRDSEIKDITKSMDITTQVYTDFYKEHTSLSPSQIDEYQTRDIFMDAATAKKYNVIDRVVSFNKDDNRLLSALRNSQSARALLKTGTPLSTIQWHNHFHQIYAFDIAPNTTNTTNNIIDPDATPKKTQVRMAGLKKMIALIREKSHQKPLVLHTNAYYSPTTRLEDVVTIATHVAYARFPTISVIDSRIDIMRAIPAIISYRRYMYDNAYLTIALQFSHYTSQSMYYHDIKHNTELLRANLKRLLKQYTKLPNSILDSLFEKNVILSAKECKEYGIIDEIIASSPQQQDKKTTPRQIGGCGCSQGLAYDFSAGH